MRVEGGVEGFEGPVAQLVECPFRKERNNEITGGTGIEARQVHVLNSNQFVEVTFLVVMSHEWSCVMTNRM